jgi:hypothetical protein
MQKVLQINKRKINIFSYPKKKKKLIMGLAAQFIGYILYLIAATN